MKVIGQKGKYSFIVQDERGYFFVDIRYNEATQADPPDSYDCFLKSGYWEEAGEIDEQTTARIAEAMTHIREPREQA
jgi:hypothetical protein